MKIRTVKVTAGRVLPHPLESYANIRPEITLDADLEEGEDPDQAARALQGKAESLLEQHAEDLKKFLQDQEIRRQRAQELKSLRERIDRDKERLVELQDAEKRDASDPTVKMVVERIEENSAEAERLEEKIGQA
jgi:hypothetical protein